MRVLWFTSVTPPAVSRRCGTDEEVGPASWVESLRSAVKAHTDLQLAIASPWRSAIAPFEDDAVTYYTVAAPPAASRLGRAAAGWRESLSAGVRTDGWLDVVRDFDPDVIHVHGTENPFGLVRQLTKVPVVVSLQGIVTMVLRSLFGGQSTAETARRLVDRSFILGRGQIHGYFRGTQTAKRERAILRANDAFIGRTEWDRAVLQAFNPSARYFHCDEVLRPPFYEALWDRDTCRPLTVFCTSSDAPLKGADCVIEALSLLRASGLPEARLRIAGIPTSGPGSEFFHARARGHGVADAIDWLGRLDADQLAGELLQASVFAYPSYMDNSPNALCEALLAGVPSVASYVGGIPSLVDDGHEGLLFPAGDPYALAAKLRRLMEDPALAGELGASARRRALHRHDETRIVTDLAAIYAEVVS